MITRTARRRIRRQKAGEGRFRRRHKARLLRARINQIETVVQTAKQMGQVPRAKNGSFLGVKKLKARLAQFFVRRPFGQPATA